jgi:hypothetical protein
MRRYIDFRYPLHQRHMHDDAHATTDNPHHTIIAAAPNTPQFQQTMTLLSWYLILYNRCSTQLQQHIKCSLFANHTTIFTV